MRVELKPIDEKPSVINNHVIVKDKNEMPIVSVNYKIPVKAFGKLTRKEIDIASYLITTCELSKTSDFNEYLKNSHLVVGGLGYYYQFYDDYLVLTLTANSDNPDELIKEIEKKISNLDVNIEDIERKKRAAFSTAILIFDNINDYARGFTHEFMNYGEDTFIETDVLKNMKLETVKQVEEVYKKADAIVEVIAEKE